MPSALPASGAGGCAKPEWFPDVRQALLLKECRRWDPRGQQTRDELTDTEPMGPICSSGEFGDPLLTSRALSRVPTHRVIATSCKVTPRLKETLSESPKKRGRVGYPKAPRQRAKRKGVRLLREALFGLVQAEPYDRFCPDVAGFPRPQPPL